MVENRAKHSEAMSDELGFRTGLGLTRHEVAQLGAFGVLRQSCRLCCGSRLLSFQFAVVLPFVIVQALYQTFLLQIIDSIFLFSSPGVHPPPTVADVAPDVSWWLILLGVAAAIIILSIAIAVEAALFSAVGSIYWGKNMTVAQALQTVPRLWVRLLVTTLLGFVFLWAVTTVAILPATFLILFRSTEHSYVLVLFIFVVSVVAGILCFVISVLSTVASAVTCYEESYGWAAYKRATNVLKEKWISAFFWVFVGFMIVGFGSIWNSVPDLFEHGFKWSSVVLVPVGLLIRSCVNQIVSVGWAIFYFSCAAKYQEVQKTYDIEVGYAPVLSDEPAVV